MFRRREADVSEPKGRCFEAERPKFRSRKTDVSEPKDRCFEAERPKLFCCAYMGVLLRVHGSFVASARKNFNLRRKLLNLRRSFIVFPWKIIKFATQIKELLRTRSKSCAHSQVNYSARSWKVTYICDIGFVHSKQKNEVRTQKTLYSLRLFRHQFRH